MKTRMLLVGAALISTHVAAQDILTDREAVAFDDPEGWAMAHTLSASLNLSSVPPAPLDLWQIAVSGDLGSIPRLSYEEQRVGFGGFKYEDMNKSPVFGRGRVHLGLPYGVTAEASWTPPLELNGARPKGVFGLAVEKAWPASDRVQLSGRLYALRGDATGDITCDAGTAAFPPGTLDNPFGCRAPSDDRLTLDHQGVELLAATTLGAGQWQPYLSWAWTRMDTEAQVNARVYEVLDRSVLTTKGHLNTATLGLAWHPSATWTASAAYSYTPLDVRRPPDRQVSSGDFWSVRLGLQWRPEVFR